MLAGAGKTTISRLMAEIYLYHFQVERSNTGKNWSLGTEDAAGVTFPLRGVDTTKDFKSTVISHSAITRKLVQIDEDDKFEITVPNSIPLVNLDYSQIIKVYGQVMLYNTVTRKVQVISSGPIVRERRDADLNVTLTFQGLTGFQDLGRSSIQKNCRHILYDSGCGVDRSRFMATADVVDTNAQNIILNNYIPIGEGIKAIEDQSMNNLFLLGALSYQHDGEDIHHSINAVYDVTGGLFEVGLSAYPRYLVAGDRVNLVCGCRLTRKECTQKFGNIIRFGGFILPKSERVGARNVEGDGSKISVVNIVGGSVSN